MLSPTALLVGRRQPEGAIRPAAMLRQEKLDRITAVGVLICSRAVSDAPRSDLPQLPRRFRLQMQSKKAYYFMSLVGYHANSVQTNFLPGGLYEQISQVDTLSQEVAVLPLSQAQEDTLPQQCPAFDYRAAVHWRGGGS